MSANPNVEVRDTETVPLSSAAVDKRSLIELALVAFIVLIIVRNAWLGDDAYISFRTVDNFVNGRGLTRNPGQRVQAFTHPAWFFVVSAAYALTGEIYYTAIALSVLVSTAALVLAVRALPATPWAALPALIALGFSRAFVEFSTSGLENPLSHLLLIAWAVALLRPKHVAFDLLSGAIVFNRFDLALLIAPGWLWVMWQRRRAGAGRHRLLVHVACAGGPILLWLAFATFYFGFALPNTAYAKLGVQIALGDRLAQGFFYTLHLVSTDPASALVLVLAAIIAWRSRDAVLRVFALGIALYPIYLHCIGGDFMSGRFFAAPVVVACIVLMRANYDRATSFGLAAALGVMGWAGPAAPMWSGVELEGRSGGKVQLSRYRIVDERRFYYPDTGLLAADRVREMPSGRFRAGGMKLRGRRGAVVAVLGMRSFIAGPDAALIDPFALPDPFRAFAAVPRGIRQRLETGPRAAPAAGGL